jgi:hypothetical protein
LGFAESDLTSKYRQSLPIDLAQILYEDREIPLYLFGESLRELSTFGGEGHVDRPSIIWPGSALDQSPSLRASHEPCDARLVEIQEPRELHHCRFVIAQDAQQSRLDER